MATIRFPFDHTRISTAEAFRDQMASAGYQVPVSADLTALKRSVSAGGRRFDNSMAIQPLEGLDGEENGAPSSLTFARYEKLAAQGAGILWVEATAVCPEGRDGARQLWLHEGSREGFRKLTKLIDEAAAKAGHRPPYKIIQLTHSGRCSRNAAGEPAPMAAFASPYLDPFMGKPQIVTDQYLDHLQEQVADAAQMACEAGFDAAELKLCHQYLFKELLCAYTRPGKYGGSRENRFRFALETIDQIRRRLGDRLDIAVRLNAYDGIPWPYGWGMARGQEEGTKSNWQGNLRREDLSEEEKSNWSGNPRRADLHESEKSSWQGNPRHEELSAEEKSSWQGNRAFSRNMESEKSNWSGNPAPFVISDEEKSSWQGNPDRRDVQGSTATNWAGNPVFCGAAVPPKTDPAPAVDPARPGPMAVDLSEVKELIGQLSRKGVSIFNLTTTSPRFAPEGKGYMDNFSSDAEIDPFAGVSALLRATKEIRRACPSHVRIIGTGLSWFGPFSANVGAGGIEEGCFDIAGFGRSVMADSDFIPAILRGGQPARERACLGCDRCFRLFFAGLPTGCACHCQAYTDLYRTAFESGRAGGGGNIIY